MVESRLPPSQRIDLVQRVRDDLIDETEEQADLVLRTFGLAGLDLESEWQHYDSRVDIRTQTMAADDATLLAIAHHFAPRDVDPSADDFVHLWRPGHVRAFISHLAPHQRFASEVVDALREFDVDGFVAHTSIEPDNEWQVEIERALVSCDVFVGLLHPGFSDSYWTQQEIGWALGRGVPVTMVSLGEDPVGFRAKHQAAHATQVNSRSAANRILVWLSKHPEYGTEITAKLVASLQEASFVDAREAAKRLQAMGSLSPAILDAIVRAYETNNQIAGHVAGPFVRSILTEHNRPIPPH